jgi:hypothetical protein
MSRSSTAPEALPVLVERLCAGGGGNGSGQVRVEHSMSLKQQQLLLQQQQATCCALLAGVANADSVAARVASRQAGWAAAGQLLSPTYGIRCCRAMPRQVAGRLPHSSNTRVCAPVVLSMRQPCVNASIMICYQHQLCLAQHLMVPYPVWLQQCVLPVLPHAFPALHMAADITFDLMVVYCCCCCRCCCCCCCCRKRSYSSWQCCRVCCS